MTLQAAQAFSTIALRSGGREFHLALLTISSLPVAVSCQPRSVVIFRGPLQPELAVEIGAYEFGGVDHTALQRREDFAHRQQPDVNADRLVHAPGEAWNAHLQALEVIQFLDRLLEPPGHLHPCIATQEQHQVKAVVRFAPKLQAAAVVHPAVESLKVEPERDGCEILTGEKFAGPEIGIGVIHLDSSGRDGVKAFRRRN